MARRVVSEPFTSQAAVRDPAMQTPFSVHRSGLVNIHTHSLGRFPRPFIRCLLKWSPTRIPKIPADLALSHKRQLSASNRRIHPARCHVVSAPTNPDPGPAVSFIVHSPGSGATYTPIRGPRPLVEGSVDFCPRIAGQSLPWPFLFAVPPVCVRPVTQIQSSFFLSLRNFAVFPEPAEADSSTENKKKEKTLRST